MASGKKIQLRRGTLANLPTLDEGEPGFCTDTYNLYIGSDVGNKMIGGISGVKVEDYNANTILKADVDDTPAALTIPVQTLVGRVTGGTIDALTGAEALTVLCTTASRILGQKSSGDCTTLTGAEVKTILNPEFGIIDALMDYGSGTSYTKATIDAALTAIGTTNKRTLILRHGTWTIDANADWSTYTNVTFKLLNGAVLTHTTKTINIPNLDAGIYQVFSGTGTVSFGSQIHEAYPEWWGIDGTADQTEINKTIIALSTYGGTVKLLPREYTIADSITATSYVSIEGTYGEIPHSGVTGDAGTRIIWAGGANGYMIYAVNVRQSRFEGFCLDGQGNTTLTGILYDSTDGSSAECRFDRFSIRDCYIGVQWGTTDLAGGAYAAQATFRTFTIWSSVASSWGFVVNSGNVGQQSFIEHGGIQCGTAAGGGGIDLQYCNLLAIKSVFGGGTHGSYFIKAGYAQGLLIQSCSSEMWGPGSAVAWRHNDAYFLYVDQPAQGATSTKSFTITMIENQINNPIVVNQEYRIVSVGDNWGQCKDSVTEADVFCMGTFTTDVSRCLALNNGVWPTVVDATTGLPAHGWIYGDYVNLTNLDPGIGWTVPAFDAGIFTASSSTWTVAEADVETFAYKIIERTMTVSFKINLSSVGGTPASLKIAIPAGKVATRGMTSMIRLLDSEMLVDGIAYVDVSGTTINIQRSDLGNFSASTDTTTVQGQITFEIN